MKYKIIKRERLTDGIPYFVESIIDECETKKKLKNLSNITMTMMIMSGTITK